MIKTFKNTDTQELFNGERVKRFVNIETVALRIITASALTSNFVCAFNSNTAMRLMLKLLITTRRLYAYRALSNTRGNFT
jgi:hypothetical protein